MNKAFGIVFALVLVLSFSGCSSSNEEISIASTFSSNAPATSQPEPTTAPAAEDEYADLSHLREGKIHFFQKLGFAPSSLRTALNGSDFLSTAHRGVVSVYTGNLCGNDKKNEAIVVSLLDGGGVDRIQANYYYSGEEGLATEILLSAPLDSPATTTHPHSSSTGTVGRPISAVKKVAATNTAAVPSPITA